MRVLIRADASARIGTGHVVRTKTLARELIARGAKVAFVCRALAGNMISALTGEGFDVRVLSAPPEKNGPNSVHSGWPGVPQDVDALETTEQLDGPPWDWVLVDHYSLDAQWETALRPHARRIMAIDDLADRRHECDLLLDQNFAQSPKKRYYGLVPADCALLLGPRFALLRPEYAKARTTDYREKAVKNVLVFFGGSAPSLALKMALSALSRADLGQLDVDVVLGATAAPEPDFSIPTRSGGVRFHRGLPHLAHLMAHADIAIGAGGTTTWERMCMGLPSIVASIATNQQPACAALARNGLICYLGPLQATTTEAFAKAISGLAADAKGRFRMAVAGMDMVDGHGANRVANALYG